MSGRITCQQIEDRKEQIKNNQNDMNTLLSASTLGLSKFFYKDDPSTKNNEVYNILSTAYNKVKDTVSVNSCQNVSDVYQGNIFIQPSSCYTAINKNCWNNITNKPDVACLTEAYKILDFYSNKPITQTNINNQTAECEINSILGVLTKQEQSIDNLALMKLIREESIHNSSSDNTCNEISTDVTTQTYIRSFLDCLNDTIVNQNNIIENGCYPGISSQLNSNKDINKCLIQSGIFNKTAINNSIDNNGQTIPITILNTSTTPPPTTSNNNIITYVIIGIIVIVLIIVIYFATKPTEPVI